jgi:Flp pilus assembly protein TadG
MRRRLRYREEDGQGMVEFMIVLPFLLMLLFAIIQFGIAFNQYLTITDAARVGARAAAVAYSSGQCTAALTAVQNDVSNSEWSVISSGGYFACSPGANPGDQLTVTVQYPCSISIPFIGVSLCTSPTMTATAKERVE